MYKRSHEQEPTPGWKINHDPIPADTAEFGQRLLPVHHVHQHPETDRAVKAAIRKLQGLGFPLLNDKTITPDLCCQNIQHLPGCVTGGNRGTTLDQRDGEASGSRAYIYNVTSFDVGQNRKEQTFLSFFNVFANLAAKTIGIETLCYVWISVNPIAVMIFGLIHFIQFSESVKPPSRLGQMRSCCRLKYGF